MQSWRSQVSQPAQHLSNTPAYLREKYPRTYGRNAAYLREKYPRTYGRSAAYLREK